MRFKYLFVLTPLLAVLACSGTSTTKDAGASGSSGDNASAGSVHSAGSGNSASGSANGGATSSAGTANSAGNDGTPASGGDPNDGSDEGPLDECDQCFANKCAAESMACWDEPNCDAAQLHYDDCIASLTDVPDGAGGAPGEASGGGAGVLTEAGATGTDVPSAPKTRADCKALAIIEAKQLDAPTGAAGAAGEVSTLDNGKLVDQYLTCFETNCLAACEGP